MCIRLTILFFIVFYAFADFVPDRKCSNTQFECDDGQCIPKWNWCVKRKYSYSYQAHKDCDDDSNNDYCSQRPYSCDWNYAYCSDSGMCIPKKWICDGYSDCEDNSDERGCLNPWNEFVEISRIINARDRAIRWINEQRRASWGWGKDSARAIVSLYFNDEKQFHSGNERGLLMLKQAKIRLFEMLSRNDSTGVPDHKIANYIHTFLAACQDARNFIGINLIELLQERLTHPGLLNPFVTLVLCNSNSSLPSSTIERLFEIMLKPSKPEIVDHQAYAAMTLSCLRRRNPSVLESTYQNFLRPMNSSSQNNNITKGVGLFKNLQRKDGSYGSISTTSIVIQALLSAGNYGTHNLKKAYEYILQQQKPDGSFGSMLNTYLVLPLLYNKTLLDLGSVNCPEKNRFPTLREEFELLKTRKQKVTYSIWLGASKDISFQMSVTVPVNVSFYDVMRLAAELDSKYNFQYIQYHNGKYVYSIFNTTSDPEAGLYWNLYSDQGEEIIFAGFYADKVIPKDGDKFVYWYKHHVAPPLVPMSQS